MAFFDQVRMLAAWCELRGDYRHFRIDRIRSMVVLDERPPRRRADVKVRRRSARTARATRGRFRFLPSPVPSG